MNGDVHEDDVVGRIDGLHGFKGTTVIWMVLQSEFVSPGL